MTKKELKKMIDEIKVRCVEEQLNNPFECERILVLQSAIIDIMLLVENYLSLEEGEREGERE